MVNFSFNTTGSEIVSAFPDQFKNRTFLITGPSANSIGAETVLTLVAGAPSTFLLLGRSKEKIQPVIDEVARINPSIRSIFIHISLDSLSSVRTAAQTILSDTTVPKIDVIFNSAGVMACTYSHTVDGIETQLGVNHISHFLLTNVLLPKVLAAGSGAHVINVASYGSYMSDMHYDDLDWSGGKTYNTWLAYGQSKTANILFTIVLNTRLQRAGYDPSFIRTSMLNPGSVESNLTRHAVADPEVLRLASKVAEETNMGLGKFPRKTRELGVPRSRRRRWIHR